MDGSNISGKFVSQRGELDFLWVELTNKCNLECTHCYANSSPYEEDESPLSLRQQEEVLSEAFDKGARGVQFIGGEPTLNKNLPLLIECAATLGFSTIEVFSNLVALPKRLLEVFVKHKVCVATSAYSHLAEKHDEITTRPGSWARTANNIELVVTAGLKLRVAIVDFDCGAEHLERTTQWLKGLGVVDIGYDRVRQFGRGEKSKPCEMGELCGECSNGTLCVGPDGIVSPCIMSKFWPVGNLHTESMQHIISSDALKQVRYEISCATQRNEAIEMGSCNPDRPHPCGPDRGDSCNPCNPKGHCGPNACQPVR